MTEPSVDHVQLYGLRISSELPLHQDREPTGPGPDDVTIQLGTDIPATLEPPPGRLLLDLAFAQRMYCAAQHDDGSLTFRCHRVCDFEINRDLDHVIVRMMEGGAPELASVLATGTLLSFILAMRGHAVLHSSAVHVGDGAVAFVGMSGMGKSTMAGLMCAAGADLITDDVLRVDLDGTGAPPCYLGATELRLRKGADELAARFDAAPARRHTQDDRQAVRMRGATVDRLPLRGIVIPQPHHEGVTTLAVDHLDPKEALLTLIRFPRILGWQDRTFLGRHFQELADITARVPVFVANMPWGPPFPDDVAHDLLAAMGLADVDPA